MVAINSFLFRNAPPVPHRQGSIFDTYTVYNVIIYNIIIYQKLISGSIAYISSYLDVRISLRYLVNKTTAAATPVK